MAFWRRLLRAWWRAEHCGDRMCNGWLDRYGCCTKCGYDW